VILNFTIKSEHVDLNVTPEKRTVFVAIEGKLLDALRGFLTQHFSQNAAVPLVFNEASQTATIPQRFPPALVLRNKSAPTPVAVSSVSQSLSSSSSSSSSATPKLFEAFGFKRHASAPALWPPAASLPVAPAKQEVAECRHHDHHNHDVGWDELVIVDEERDVDIEIVDEAKQGQRSVSNAMAVAVDADEGPKQNKNVFAEMFGFGSLKRPRVEVEPVVSLIPPASDAIEMPVMLQDAKRGKIELNDNVEMEDRVVPLSQDVPVSPLEHQDERADERDVRTSYSFSPLSASSSSSSSVLEFDLDAVRWAVKRRRDALVEGSQRAKSEMPAMFKKEYFNRLQVVGQFNNGFIITRFDDTSDLFIVDQHASNEIFNFETLQKSTVLRVQRLLVPIPIDFSPAEEIDVVSNMNVFERNGFLLECDENSMPGKKIKLVGRYLRMCLYSFFLILERKDRNRKTRHLEKLM
jgi:DNA mismatch repair protein PMS2